MMRRLSLLLTTGVLAGGACGGGSPAGPSPLPTASLQISISPNPVPFSGTPITDIPICVGLVNTWFYEQTFTETVGVAVTLTSYTDVVDGVARDEVTGLNLSIGAKGTVTRRWSICRIQPSGTHQTTFRGTDANGHAVTFTGPVATLQARQ